VLLFTFIVGALGTWVPDNIKPIKAIFLSNSEKAFAYATIRSNIPLCARQWVAFNDGRDTTNLSRFRYDQAHDARAPEIEGPIFEDTEVEVAVPHSFQ